MKKLIESIKLRHRAYRYKNRDDKGGIAYITKSIKFGQTVLDIGAHKAGYLYFFKKLVGKTGKVYAFEPQSNLYNYINTIKNLFQWNNVWIENLALSDAAGVTTLYIPTNTVRKTSSPGATLLRHKERTDFERTETVRTDFLDSYCDRHTIKPDFLKIDVEGNELSVLKGAIATLQKYKPKILVEIEAQHVGQQKVLETFDFLLSLGYKGHVLHGLDAVPLSEFDFSKHQNVHDKKNYCNNFAFEQK